MKFTRLNAINERILQWQQRKTEALKAWSDAAKYRDATAEWDQYLWVSHVCEKLRQMLADEEAKPSVFVGVNKMVWRWIWWAKRCMTRDRPAHQ